MVWLGARLSAVCMLPLWPSTLLPPLPPLGFPLMPGQAGPPLQGSLCHSQVSGDLMRRPDLRSRQRRCPHTRTQLGARKTLFHAPLISPLTIFWEQ